MSVKQFVWAVLNKVANKKHRSAQLESSHISRCSSTQYTFIGYLIPHSYVEREGQDALQVTIQQVAAIPEAKLSISFLCTGTDEQQCAQTCMTHEFLVKSSQEQKPLPKMYKYVPRRHSDRSFRPTVRYSMSSHVPFASCNS